MQGIRVCRIVCATVFLTGGLAFGTDVRLEAELNAATAASTKSTTTNPTNQTPISIAFKFEGGPGQIPTTRAYITAGTNKFAFLVPDEYKLASSDPQKVTLMKGDGSCLISVRVIGSKPASDKP